MGFLLFSSLSANAYEWKNVLGEPTVQNRLYLGTFIIHNPTFIDDLQHRGIGRFFRPDIGISSHSLFLTYFKNSNWDDTVAFGIERSWYNYKKDNRNLILGYRLGGLYGYCLTKEKYRSAFSIDNLFATYKCREDTVHVLRVMPMLYLDYAIGHFGISLNEAFAVTTLNVFYRW